MDDLTLKAITQMIIEAVQSERYSASISREGLAILDDKDKVKVVNLHVSIFDNMVAVEWCNHITIGDPDFNLKVRKQVGKSIAKRLDKCVKEIDLANKRKTRLEELKGLYES